MAKAYDADCWLYTDSMGYHPRAGLPLDMGISQGPGCPLGWRKPFRLWRIFIGLKRYLNSCATDHIPFNSINYLWVSHSSSAYAFTLAKRPQIQHSAQVFLSPVIRSKAPIKHLRMAQLRLRRCGRHARRAASARIWSYDVCTFSWGKFLLIRPDRYGRSGRFHLDTPCLQGGTKNILGY